MKYELELQAPTMPNFITFKQPSGRRQDGFKSGHGISVSDLTESQAIEYAELIKQKFIEHWKLKKDKPLAF